MTPLERELLLKEIARGTTPCRMVMRLWMSVVPTLAGIDRAVTPAAKALHQLARCCKLEAWHRRRWCHRTAWCIDSNGRAAKQL